MVFPVNEVGYISENILGMTDAQANAISRNGWVNVADFEGYSTKDIEKWAATSTRTAVNRGGCSFASVRVRRICALSYWVNRQILRGVPLIAANFNADVLRESQNDFPIYDLQLDSDDSVDKPDQFTYDKWIDWQESVITYLKGKKSISKVVPLYYVIRPVLAPVGTLTEEEEIIFNTPHNGVAYTADNKTVHTVLTELTNGTDADTWIKQHRRSQDGRAAWRDLCTHYDGPAEGDKRVTVARNDIKIVHYRNESTFSFEKYSSRLKHAFTTLSTYNQPKSEREKVQILLEHINTNDQQLITAIGICRDSHSRTFEQACQYLSQQVAIIYPQHQPNAFGRRGKGGKKPYVRNVHAVQTKGGKTFCNGVNLTNTTRYFSAKEFSKLGKEGRDYLAKCPKRKAAKEAHRSGKKNRTGDNDDSNRLIAAVINGVTQASRHERGSDTGSLPSQIGTSTSSMPQHGPHARASNTSAASTSSRQTRTYDHLGNVVNGE